MNITVSFSGRKNGNCDDIARYISSDNDEIIFMRDIPASPCANCDYECFTSVCKYRDDGVYSLFKKLAAADRLFFVIPMYCGNPSALYFILNERCQDFFMHNESLYADFIKKLYIIGIYGDREKYPEFINTLAEQYAFDDAEKHVLGLERHKYDQKLRDRLLDVPEVKEKIDIFIGK